MCNNAIRHLLVGAIPGMKSNGQLLYEIQYPGMVISKLRVGHEFILEIV